MAQNASVMLFYSFKLTSVCVLHIHMSPERVGCFKGAVSLSWFGLGLVDSPNAAKNDIIPTSGAAVLSSTHGMFFFSSLFLLNL